MRGPSAARIADLVPDRVSVSEGAIGEFTDELMPCERCAVERAVPKRRREFAAGRARARAALAGLGVAPVAIPQGRRREPLWLGSIVGSITHTDSYCAAAVARASDVAALGIDVERADAVCGDLVRMVGGDAELRRCELAAPPAFACASLLFSIKESVFKAVYPLLGLELGFLDVVIDVEFRSGSFRARPALGKESAAASLAVLQGAFGADARNVLAVAWIPEPHGPGDARSLSKKTAGSARLAGEAGLPVLSKNILQTATTCYAAFGGDNKQRFLPPVSPKRWAAGIFSPRATSVAEPQRPECAHTFHGLSS